MDNRHKNKNWELPTDNNGRIQTWDYVKLAVLMDIRDELQKLNALLHCPNFVEIPRVLRDIRRKMPTPRATKRRKTI